MEMQHMYILHAQQFGYPTAYSGKYLNQYGYNHSTDLPVGWDFWFGLVGTNYVYYNYSSLVEGGVERRLRFTNMVTSILLIIYQMF
jgi:hypothetical protein